MIKKRESEIRTEMARLRAIAVHANASVALQLQAHTTADALYWLLDTDAGVASVADTLFVWLDDVKPDATPHTPSSTDPTPDRPDGFGPPGEGTTAPA